MAKNPKPDAAEQAEATPALRIMCSRPGFWRAGMPHPAEAEYPAGTFTAEQLEALRAEPMLIVVEI